MSGCTTSEKELTKEEQMKLQNMAKAMGELEIKAFLNGVKSKYMWDELMRRESESTEKLQNVLITICGGKDSE